MIKTQILEKGYVIYPNALPAQVTQELLNQIIHTPLPQDNSYFRAHQDLFAIRNLLGEIPSLKTILKNNQVQQILQQQFLTLPVRCIKAIYFDKPPQSNWVVNWHQDLTINVKQKPNDVPKGFKKWIKKAGFWSVQPPVNYLENIVTLRIHLDECTVNNGALKVLEASHIPGIKPSQNLTDLKKTYNEITCEVPKGGIFVMSPLLWHASSKNKSMRHRRVIHLEFSNLKLPEHLEWFEGQA
ncbi:phytanoyl-CoA dioxygenase family protein [Microscilla marina]|uniref:Phytanoyl-CoA dioxygenase (PhyH) superfamily n=1 Tax=Microscilla marina ATCC 23134 TaxID=313606 RepID=A1ZP90_MICM2|nr:phytanoyl-CoA dioxygenase family protein [Microscilla marina]EAY27882.1 phytanoyl-CoA dioxygenase (PhyH) superfamily [Microscilla marina ATCC 23134]